MNIEDLTDEKALKEFPKKLLDLDSEFYFKCRKCGKCCVHQDTILFNTRDIFRIAKNLGKPMDAVINEYTEIYLGQGSLIPIVHLLPRGKKEECPFLQDGRCSIQDSKPIVCALYPVSRAIIDKRFWGGEKGEVQYFLQDTSCGSQKQRHTVRDWLGRFGIPEHDEFFILWSDAVGELGHLFHSLVEKKVPENFLNPLWDATFFFLYVNYDTSKDFMPQFQAATETLMHITKKAKTHFGIEEAENGRKG